MAESTDEFLAAWRYALADADQAALTCRRYLAAVRAFISWFERENHEPFTLQRLTPIDLTGYRTWLQQRHAVSTVNVHIGALRSLCTWLHETGRVPQNPAQRLKSVASAAPLAPKALTALQVNALLREAQQTRHGLRDYAIVQVLVQTGLRISECAALRVGDVKMSERHGTLTIRMGKGNKVRTVPLNASARRALLDYVAERWGWEADWTQLPSTWAALDPTRALWHSQKHPTLSVRAMSELVEHVVARCTQRELVPPETSAHTLRHTFATAYLRDHPGDLVGLAALLGHSSLETTRIYVQPTAADLAQRVEDLRLNAYV
ncbi:tyrosine-type recombinase/integrase [Chloroflexia bacterium SDU3-3]|nr:tyrosine-type recombinase/integrase [Chloroflexia bacterium SDU3-3]